MLFKSFYETIQHIPLKLNLILKRQLLTYRHAIYHKIHMPTLGFSIAIGLVSGLAGGLVMAIVMMFMGKRVKTSPPAIMAEKMFGDLEKKPMILFPVMSMWGIVYGIVVSVGGFTSYIATGIWFSLIPWTVLNLMMLPMAGAGIFGMKR